MNINKLGLLLTFLSNVSVIGGIVFLAIEISQNTDMIQIQTAGQEQQRILGRYIDTPDLATIETKLGSVAGTYNFSTEIILVNDYGLTNAEAKRWTRYVMDMWLSNSINYRQSNSCSIGARVALQPYNRQLFTEVSTAGLLNPEYAKCVTETLR